MSSGLETLIDDARITSSDHVKAFLHGQLVGRWANFDRPVVVAVYRAEGDLDKIAEVDTLVEAQTLAEESRTGSRRSGCALLGVHVKLGAARALEYQGMVGRSMANGHNTVVQGLVWSETGITESLAEVMSAHLFCTGLVSAALRLNTIGHLDAQHIISSTYETIERILAAKPPGLESLFAFTPEQEIAVMRHESMPYRLFVN